MIFAATMLLILALVGFASMGLHIRHLRRRATTAEARLRAAMPVDHWREMGGDRVLEALLVDEAERALRGER